MSGPISTEQVVCSNCGRDDAIPIATGRDHEYRTSAEDFTFVRCDCGLVYLNPRPATSELDRIYPEDYYAYQLIACRAASAGGSRSFLGRYMDARATARLAPYVERLRETGPGRYRVLDVGCGDGATLNIWRRALGEDVETYGIEMNRNAAEIAARQGHRVTTSRIEEAELPREHFDLVYSSHVIEHVTDPASFLSAIRVTLKPTGFAIVDTPNVDTLDYRWFGARHWGAFHFPRHFNLYDERTFGALARKTGLEIVQASYQPSAIHWVWTVHSALSSSYPNLADRLFPPVKVFLSGSLWTASLLSAFTAVDLLLIATTGRSSNLRLLLRPAR